MNFQSPKNQYLLAMALGLLSIPCGFVIVFIFIIFKKITGINLGDLIGGLPFGLALMGIVLEAAIFLVLFLIKAAIPMAIAWVITRSRAMVGMTLVAAAGVELIILLSGNPQRVLRDLVTQQFFHEIAAEKNFRESVLIESTIGSPVDPLKVSIAPQYGQTFQKLIVDIVLTARNQGEYILSLHFQGSNSGDDIYKTNRIFLNKGPNQVRIEFLPADFKRTKYWLKQGESELEVKVSQLRTEESIFGINYNAKPQNWEIARKVLKINGVGSIAPITPYP